METNKTTASRVLNFSACIDASGASAIVRVFGGFEFSANYIGRPSLHPITRLRGEGGKRAYDAASAAAEAAFMAEVNSLGAEWLERCRAMYSEAA